MKKLTMLLLVIALVFSAALAEPLSKSALFGSWSDSNYTNETIGLGFTVDDWHLYSQEEIMAANQWQNIVTDEQVAEMVASAQQFMIMQAERADKLQNVNIGMQDMSEYAAMIPYLDMDEFVGIQVSQVKTALEGMSVTDFQAEQGVYTVGDEEWHGFTGSYTLMGIPMHVRQAYVFRDTYLVIITATTALEDNTGDIYARFYAI